MMKEEDFTLLDNFFNGLLSNAERETVRTRAKTDPEFRQEFELRTRMEAWLTAISPREQLKTDLDRLGQTHFNIDKGTSKMPAQKMAIAWRKILAVAAAMSSIGIALWLLRPPKPDQLYARYFNPDPLQLTQRSGGQSLTTEAEKAFESKNYRLALEKLELLARDSLYVGNNQIELYRGICMLELNQTDNAINALKSIASGNTAWAVEARWYQALAHLKRSEKPEATALLKQFAPSDNHYPSAIKLLKQIK